jgi:hypothetical protein
MTSSRKRTSAVQVVSVGLCLPAFVVVLPTLMRLAGMSPRDAAQPAADPVRRLGVTRGEPLDNGFFFYKGEYVEPPYRIDRRGVEVVVNGRPVYRWSSRTDAYQGEPAPTRSTWDFPDEQVVRHVDTWRDIHERYFRSGDCLFILAEGRRRLMARETAARDLKLAVGILRSDRTPDEKFDLLQRMGFLRLPDDPRELYEPLLTGFRASEQLDARIKTLTAETGITPRGYEDIPTSMPAE